MNPSALTKARKLLLLAKKSATALHDAAGEDFFGEWFTFLSACNAVYTMLEQGSKTSPQSRQWFGAVKARRRASPLYQYLFQARHDDAHGVGQVTEYVPGAIYFEEEGGHREPLTERGRELLQRFFVLGKEASGTVRVTGQAPHVRLLPVTGRGGVVYQPPLEHEGHVFAQNAPPQMAHFMVEFLETIIAEAERLA